MVRKRGSKWTVVMYDRGTRKKVWVGTYDSEAAAKKAEAKWLLDHNENAVDTELIGSFAARWTIDFPRRKESTNLTNAERIRDFAEVYKHRPLDSIMRREARRYALNHPGRVGAIRAMFTDAKHEGLCKENPFANLRLPERRGRRDLVVLTEADVKSLARAAFDELGDFGRQVFGPMIVFAAYSGLRPGELHALKWTDVDTEAELIRVERQFSSRTQSVTTPKNDKSRTLYLTPPAAEALQQVARSSGAPWVFTVPRGVHFRQTTQRYYWEKVRVKAGRSGMDWYELRHFFGTYLARLGLGPIEIAQAMGHQDGGKLAMERYIHLSERDARAKIRRAFQRPPELSLIDGDEDDDDDNQRRGKRESA